MKKSFKESRKTICIANAEVLIKRYKVRATGNAKSTIQTSVPREAFEREMRRLGLTPEEALEKVVAVWKYNSFPGLHLTFELVKEGALHK